MTKGVVDAQVNVATARAALINTARELQLRLQPKTLARDAWESAKVKGADIAEEAVDVVRQRPVVTGGIVAAVAMFLARAPIKDGVVRLVDAMTSDDDKRSKAIKSTPRATSTPRNRKPADPAPKRAPRARRKTETK